MRYAHIDLEDQAKVVGKLKYGKALANSFAEDAGESAADTNEGWQQYVSRTRGAKGQMKAITDKSGQSSEAGEQKKNPGVNRGFDLTNREVALIDKLNQWMEAAGNSPGGDGLGQSCPILIWTFASDCCVELHPLRNSIEQNRTRD